MSPEETREQLRDAESLAYQHIRFSGLYKELSGSEWDELAKKWAPVICAKLDQLVDAERARIELQSERDELEAA